jgi:hypothetical protein
VASLLIVRGQPGALGLAADDATDAELAHQPGDAVSSAGGTVALELAPDLLGAVAGKGLLPDLGEENRGLPEYRVSAPQLLHLSL